MKETVIKLEVSESFLREAYNAACKEWKERLEKQFPQVFNIDYNIAKLESYKEFKKEDIYINAEYLDENIPPQKLKFEIIN